MQLDVFNTDIHKNGFRLQYMEVFNWGTFDETVHTIRPMGETTLLTGANGSGKTSYIDALLTLLVPEKKYRFYNQSSGSDKKNDRTEESYVQGGYSFVNSETTGTVKTQYLRENKEEAYSILLANFTNEMEHCVTLFQVRYFSGGEMKKVYAVGQKPMQIETDFKPFDLGLNWKKRIDQQYNKSGRKQVEWFDSAAKYALRVVDALGLQSIQALHLFNQIVGIKVLQNLDDFIRQNMLESRDTEETFKDLKKHLGTLLEAQRTIEKVEAQIRLLQALKERHTAYVSAMAEKIKLDQTLEIAAIWNSFTKSRLLDEETVLANQQLVSLNQQINKVKEELATLLEGQRITRNQIENNKVGQKMQDLERQVGNLKKDLLLVENKLENVRTWLTTLHIKEEPIDENGYQRMLKELNRVFLQLQTQHRNNDDEDYETKKALENAKEEKNLLEQEIDMLHGATTNIPFNLNHLRKEICNQLKIDPNEILFAGELIQVRHNENLWQQALEKLLYSFSLRLLVPDKYYKRFTQYVNATDLRNRLVYFHVTDIPLVQQPDKESIIHKLEFHPEHKFAEYVKQQLIQQFDYVALEDDKTIARYDKAITVKGLIKNGKRHEKDDRPLRTDTEMYVMGWNSEKKKAALMRRRDKLLEIIQGAEEILKTCKSKAERIQRQFNAIERIKELPGFEAIDTNAIHRNIHKIDSQIASLRKDNKEIDALKKQLVDLEEEQKEKEGHSDWLKGERTKKEIEVQHMTEAKEALEPLVSSLTSDDKDRLLAFQAEHSKRFGEVNINNIDILYHGLRNEVEQKRNTVISACNSEKAHVERSIMRIKNPSAELNLKFPQWASDVTPFSEEAEHADEYLEWLQTLETENLPKHKQDFANFIHNTITYKIGGLNEELEKWERDITGTIGKLNQSLKGIRFNRNPDTYIQLEKRRVPAGTDQQEFKNLLLQALPQAASWGNSSFEEKAIHFQEKVKPLIDKLDESEAYRKKVIDVRNWYEFWANELFTNTHESKKVYKQMGQLSGGEKPQLTYTILCSAIAYQFGITRDTTNSKSLRFIAVDESFSNQDEEKATYLMELCKQLHLQLLVVTPSDKIQIVQDFIAHVHLAQRVNGRNSVLYNMTIKELQQKMKQN